VRSTSVSFSSVVTAFGYLAPYSVAKRVTASRACSRVSAIFGKRHGRSDREHVAPPVQVRELGCVDLLQSDLQDAGYRRVGLLDEIRLG